MSGNRERAAEITGCVVHDVEARFGPPFCATHEEDGNPPWDRCRWVPVAAALDAAEARGRAEGIAERDELARKVAAVRALHAPDTTEPRACDYCGDPYPCPTVQALEDVSPA